jgi:hypothetical protein
MLCFGMTIPATVPQRSEIPEGLMNYPAYINSECVEIPEGLMNYPAYINSECVELLDSIPALNLKLL